GSFGTVYLADDEQLNRQVAIKVPHAQHLAAPDSADVYLREARTVAGLDHPRIVPVYDVGQTAELPCYIVSKYIQGQTLADRIQTSRVSWQEAARLTAVIADALHYAHKQGVFHRDIKPANILLDAAGDPHVADFGLALREQDAGQGARYAGTPAYSSPEQARGEGHRLNGQSDLFSLGIVLYELLTGRRPFTGSNTREVLQQIATGTPKPPRSINDTFPKELEHICLKALASQASARYTTGLDFAEDLRALLVSPAATATAAGSRSVAVAPAAPLSTAPDSSGGQATQTPRASRSTVETSATPASPARVIPRGLRSFTAEDSEFFLQLLPGPRIRSGLPESIAFWKTRIEQRDAAKTFPVGLLYGPSGCGKSSLVKAGLLPCLETDVIQVYIEASALDTEDRLCRALRSRISGLSRNSDILELLTEIRRNRGRKVLIVLDQFEQWLHANPVSIDQPLVRALRQCDGGHLQTLLMIRDDFYVSVSRLMEQLDVAIQQQHNCAMVDLFDLPHAEAVLIRLGSAYDRLPDFPGELSQDQQNFIRAAVQDLAEANKVISVRLALFAQMMRSKPWVPQTLTEVGGAQGVGVAFLEETFSSPRSDVRYRRHLPAVRGMLKALLPGLDTEIRGSSRSIQELQLAAGCQDRHQTFSELLSILDAELRLITPTDTTQDSSSTASPQSASYQLTHDYLVPSLREWLLKKQKETPAGRAEIALDERTQMWTSRRESRHLPSLLEYGRIRWYLRSQKKTPAQQQLLKAADRLQLLRGTLTLLLRVAVLLLAAGLRRQAAQQRAEALAGGIAQQKTSDLAAGLVPLQLLRDYALPTLQKLYTESAKNSEARLHLAIARLQLGDQDAELLPAALEGSLVCRPEQLQPLTTLLQPWAPQLQPELRQVLQQPSAQSVTRRLHAACLLAAWEPGDGGNADTAWSQPETATFVAQQLAATNPVFVGAYQEVLRPQAARLKQPLAKLFADPQQNEVTRTIVTGLLADYAKDDVQILTDVILQADPAADKILFPLLQSHSEQALQQFHATLDRRLSPQWPDPPLNPAWTTPAAAVRAQLEAAHGVLADRYAFCLNLPLPELLALVETLRSSGYRPTRLRPVVGSAADSPRMSAVWVRDGGAFAVRPGLKQEELPQPDVNAIHDGLLLADVAYVSGTGPQSGWLTLWDEPTAAGEERRCVIGVSDQQMSGAQTQLTEQKFAAQTVLTVHNDARGQRR
ncbi:MAG: protein kinase domain-containing protein, partial [Planctomycetaceae bacterium]